MGDNKIGLSFMAEYPLKSKFLDGQVPLLNNLFKVARILLLSHTIERATNTR